MFARDEIPFIFQKNSYLFLKKIICGLDTATYVKTVPQKILQTVLVEA
jgi:hypothetical protein